MPTGDNSLLDINNSSGCVWTKGTLWWSKGTQKIKLLQSNTRIERCEGVGAGDRAAIPVGTKNR